MKTTSELWVSFKYGDTDFYEVYLTKEEAEAACVVSNIATLKYFKSLGSFKTLSEDQFTLSTKNSLVKPMTVYDALEYIKEYVLEQNEFDRNNELY